MTITRKHLDVASLALVVVGLGMAAYRFVTPFRALALVATGRSICPLPQAVQVGAALDTQQSASRELTAASKIVREEDGLVLWQTPKGSYWLPKNNPVDLLPNLLVEQDRAIYGAGENGLRSGDVVLDCGAHVGVFTRTAIAKGAKLVVAIEPAPSKVASLRRNLEKEIAAGKVIVVPKGVWDKEGMLPFHVDVENSARNSFLTGSDLRTTTIQVPLTTIDKLMEELKLDRVDFVKMDIEGAETNALTGGRAMLARFHPRMAICTYHTNEDPVDVPRVVQAAWNGYQTQCGPCEEKLGRIIPTTLFFH